MSEHKSSEKSTADESGDQLADIQTLINRAFFRQTGLRLTRDHVRRLYEMSEEARKANSEGS